MFSTEHPIYHGAGRTRPKWSHDSGRAGKITWPVDNYLDEGPRTTDWLAPGVIRHHRTIGTTVNLLLQTGFMISHLEEWGPSEEQIRAHPSWADERHRPPFLIVAARKP